MQQFYNERLHFLKLHGIIVKKFCFAYAFIFLKYLLVTNSILKSFASFRSAYYLFVL